MSLPALSGDGVVVHRGGRAVVSGVSLDVASGAWLTLIGPNGAGKTSLLMALAGLVAHDGQVCLSGRPLSALSRRQRAQQVALVPQHPIIPPGMPVAEYVALGRTAHLPLVGRLSSADRAVVADVLDRLELRSLADRSVGTLSGGERQRCLLARALAQEASVVLLDEPTTGLDLGHQAHVLDVVEDLRAERGLTVVATMHDLTLASHHADRLVLLDNGRAVATGTPAEVLDAGILSACYGTRVRVLHDEGVLIVVPAPSINAGRSGSGG